MRNRSRPTIIDVARLAGVSPTTVSYVLSGPKEAAARISEETTTRVLDVVSEVGYVPNQSARTLRLQRTGQVLFLGSRITSLYSQAIARSIEGALARHGLALNVQIGAESDHIDRVILMLQQHHADGLIIETGDEHLPELRAAAASGHAIVAIGPNRAEPAFDVMSNDDASAIQAAMRHLVDRGYSHFVLLSSLPDLLREHRTSVAYQQLISLDVSESDITMFHCPHDRIGVHNAALNFLPELPRPLAVYAGSDVSAIGVLWACHRLGARVPDDVAIVGHGNTPEIRITMPSLTTLGPINSDFAKAADLMASRLKDDSLPGRHVSEPCQLFIHEST